MLLPLRVSETISSLVAHGITGKVCRQSPEITTVMPPNGFLWGVLSSLPRMSLRVLSMALKIILSVIVTSSMMSKSVFDRSFLVPLFLLVNAQ